jgi:hypothetical protein
VERWFLAATLFGTRISARVAERAFATLDEAGLRRIGQARHVPFAGLVGLLDASGYARYDFRTAERLQQLSEIIDERYDGRASMIGRMHTDYPELRAAMLVLPGWGPVTVQLFLRELRGVWPGAQPPLDPRAITSAQHLGLLSADSPDPVIDVGQLAAAAGLDLPDLESALVRLALAHRRVRSACPGGPACAVLCAGHGGHTSLGGR